MRPDRILVNDWHVVAAARDLEAGKLVAARLLDQDIVVWRSGDGAVHAWKDQCPHRGTRLSLGRIRGDALMCAYHGWTFDTEGQCVRMPAHPSFTPPKSSCVERYRVQEKYGLVWACLGTPSRAIDLFPAYDTAGMRRFVFGPYVVDASGPRIIENFLDMSHFPFVHAGYLGQEPYTEVPDYRVTATPEEIVVTDCRFWQPAANPNAAAGSYVHYTYWIKRPLIASFTKLPDEEGGGDVAGNSLMLLVSPTEEFRSTVWKVSLVPDQVTPDEEIKHWNDLLFEQDRAIVESQRPKRLPLGLKDEKHQRCDRVSIVYRQWLRQLGVTYGTSLSDAEEETADETEIGPLR